MAFVSSAVVALIAILGFSHLGAPSVQRGLRADSERLSQLYRIGMQVDNYWRSHNSQLPSSFDQLPGGPRQDPITHTRYEYQASQGSKYQLCAVFAQQSPNQNSNFDNDPWSHPVGRYCFRARRHRRACNIPRSKSRFHNHPAASREVKPRMTEDHFYFAGCSSRPTSSFRNPALVRLQTDLGIRLTRHLAREPVGNPRQSASAALGRAQDERYTPPPPDRTTSASANDWAYAPSTGDRAASVDR